MSEKPWDTYEAINASYQTLLNSSTEVDRVCSLAQLRQLVWKANREIDEAAQTAKAAQQQQADLLQKRNNLKQRVESLKSRIDATKAVGDAVAAELDLQPLDEFLESHPEYSPESDTGKDLSAQDLLRIRIEDEKAKRTQAAQRLGKALEELRQLNAKSIALRKDMYDPSTGLWIKTKKDTGKFADADTDKPFKVDMDLLKSLTDLLPDFYRSRRQEIGSFNASGSASDDEHTARSGNRTSTDISEDQDREDQDQEDRELEDVDESLAAEDAEDVEI